MYYVTLSGGNSVPKGIILNSGYVVVCGVLARNVIFIHKHINDW